MKFKLRQFSVIFISISIILSGCYVPRPIVFDGSIALQHIENQLSFGPRVPESEGSEKVKSYIFENLASAGWIVERQEFNFDDTALTNIIAKSSINAPQLILGTHFDTRSISDKEGDAGRYASPVPGANDGASGTAVLLEMARVLEDTNKEIWLIFFDAEDQGRINNWEWSIGAEYFADNLSYQPESVVIIDMIGDINLDIYKEIQSNQPLTQLIWEEAEQLGYSSIFKNEQKYSLLDDHIPFINRGIPASLIIDFDYLYWHTNDDTFDKVSAESLEIIGNVLTSWISNQYP